MILKEFVILAKAGIQVFQWVLDPPVKPEDDKSRLNTQTLFIDMDEFCFNFLIFIIIHLVVITS